MWLAKYAIHYQLEIDADATRIYNEAFSMFSAEFIDAAFREAMNECSFIPRIADIRKVMERMMSTEEPGESKSRNPADGCQYCGGLWQVQRKHRVKNGEGFLEYSFLVPCPDIEKHRSDWQATHSKWSYEPPAKPAPSLSDIR